MDSFFNIFKLTSEDTETIENSFNNLHKNDYNELLIGKDGQLESFIDFNSQLITAPFISFVTKGKIHQFKPLPKNGRCEIWILQFQSEFIPETPLQLYASFHENGSIIMKESSCFGRFSLLCNMILDEHQQSDSDIGIVRQLLATVLAIIESERRKINSNIQEYKTIQTTTLKNFHYLLEEHYKKPEGVNFYADKLFMSARNLNIICRRILYKNISEIIINRKLLEAKNLLITTDLTVSKIGCELGFKENSHFTHVFKKKVGIAPTKFKQEMGKIII